jgi:hypothetical protein
MEELASPRESSVSQALVRAISLFWIDILVTLAVLAAIASRF